MSTGAWSGELRVLLVDDEPLARRALRQLLAAYDFVNIVGECGDGIDAAAALSERVVDVVFLDIRMPEISGLSVARDIGTRPLVVFVTAHEEHGAAAFETGATDYLVKPVTPERLGHALRRVRERLAQQEESARYRELASADADAGYLERLVVRVGARDVMIPIEDVELLAADDVYVSVFASGRKHEMRVSLDRLAMRLDPARFLRVHRSYVVPVRAVVAVHHRRGGDAVLELRNGASVPVSRRRRDLLARLDIAAARG